MHSPSPFSRATLSLLFIQFIIGYEWIHAGWEKLHAGTFPLGMTKTLASFASKNPHTWYTQTILETMERHTALLGQLVQWGEFLTGLVLILTVCSLFLRMTLPFQRWMALLSCGALLIGAFMNANFYLAAEWTSPSTSGLNMLLFWSQLALVFSWISHPQKMNMSESKRTKERIH